MGQLGLGWGSQRIILPLDVLYVLKKLLEIGSQHVLQVILQVHEHLTAHSVFERPHDVSFNLEQRISELIYLTNWIAQVEFYLVSLKIGFAELVQFLEQFAHSVFVLDESLLHSRVDQVVHLEEHFDGNWLRDCQYFISLQFVNKRFCLLHVTFRISIFVFGIFGLVLLFVDFDVVISMRVLLRSLKLILPIWLSRSQNADHMGHLRVDCPPGQWLSFSMRGHLDCEVPYFVTSDWW